MKVCKVPIKKEKPFHTYFETFERKYNFFEYVDWYNTIQYVLKIFFQFTFYYKYEVSLCLFHV